MLGIMYINIFHIRLCMDWKVVAVVAVAVVILMTAIFAGGVDIPVDVSGITGFFGALSGGGTGGNITINAILDFQKIELDTKASSIEVEILNPSSDITLGTNTIDLSAEESVTLVVSDWSGKINADDTITLEGEASKLVINGIVVTPSRNEKLVLEGLDYNELRIHAVSLPKLLFQNVDGYIYIDEGKTTVHVEGEPVELGSFSGDIIADTSLRLDGVTNKLLVSGENKLSVE